MDEGDPQGSSPAQQMDYEGRWRTQMVQPRGPLPEPTVLCSVFEFSVQDTSHKLVVSEYVNSNHLIFDFESVVFDQGAWRETRA